MAPSACSCLYLSSGFEMCGIAIEDDKKRSGEMEVNHDDLKVMDILKSVLDGECANDDLLPKLLKMNKGKVVKGILTLIPCVFACDTKIDKLERKVEKYKFRYFNACNSLLSDNYKMIRAIACLNSETELLKSSVPCDSCVGMLAKNEKLKIDYSTCVEKLENAMAEIIEINSLHSSTCSSTLNNDTFIDSNDNHNALLDINACNVSTISCTSCNDLKHEIDDLKQVRDDMRAKSVEHNEKVANLEKVVVMRQNCDLVDAYRENNYFKAKLDGSHIDVSPLNSLHNDMSDKDCNFCLVVMEDLTKLRNVHAQLASQLESTICELDELKARPSRLSACLECPKLKLELDARSLNVRKLETKLLEKSHVSITSSPCEVCVSLKGKLVHATNENTMLVQDFAYLTSRLDRTKLNEKMIEMDLSWIDECVTHSIHKLGLGYERCEDKGEISTKFVPSTTYKDEEETSKAKQIPYPPNPKPSFNRKRALKQTTNPSLPNLDGVYICMFCGHAGHLDEFCFSAREWRRGVCTMLETHIKMSSLIFFLILTLVLSSHFC
jgi:ribosome-associated translation inhibitor RaiA